MIDILNAIIAAMASVLGGILSLLPSSPFTWDLSAVSPFLGWFCYFVPVSTLVTIMGLYVSAVAIWYMYRWILRIIRFIG